ncbi:sensor histidine kinase [Gemmatimonadota bacterium]
MHLLLFFLSLTLALSLWFGLQAVVAASSHRRTAEGILRDYAEIAVAEYSRRIQEHLDLFFRDVFDEVPRRISRDPLPTPDVVRRQLNGALRRLDCRCDALRNGAAFLTVDLVTGLVESRPESLSPETKARAAAVVEATWNATPRERIAFRAAAPGEVLETATALAFNASLDASGEEGQGRAIYIIVAELSAMEELFQSWYDEGGLLPDVVAGSQPNDSLLHLAVRSPEGTPVFLSPRDDPDALLFQDSLPAEYGGLVVEAAVRPDAASALVIGGLPRARLLRLLALMVLTVGVGIAALVQIRREEELGQLRDDFISGVSHEFRTPLTQIRMFTELLADGKLRTEEERARSTDVINREARRLTHLVENILHFSRMGRAPALPEAREEVALQDAFLDLTEAFAPLASSQGCVLEARVDPPQAVVLASRTALYQMLANLLDNALKYGPSGQTVRVEAVLQEDWLRLAVEDQGPGIPPGDRARIWDPYHRLDRDVEGQVRGSGIGLSVVTELAHAAGGSAWVEDGAEGGARFVVELPAGI